MWLMSPSTAYNSVSSGSNNFSSNLFLDVSDILKLSPVKTFDQYHLGLKENYV